MKTVFMQNCLHVLFFKFLLFECHILSKMMSYISFKHTLRSRNAAHTIPLLIFNTSRVRKRYLYLKLKNRQAPIAIDVLQIFIFFDMRFGHCPSKISCSFSVKPFFSR